LKQWKVDVEVQGLGFEFSAAIRQSDESLAQALQVFQSFAEPEVLHPVDTHFDPQEGAELFVPAAYEFFTVDPQHVMALVQLFQEAVQFAAEPVW
jgi:hypothetical protein